MLLIGNRMPILCVIAMEIPIGSNIMAYTAKVKFLTQNG